MSAARFKDTTTDSTLEGILAVTRSQPESIERGLVDDDSDSDSLSALSNDQPPPQSKAPVLEEVAVSPKLIIRDVASSGEEEDSEENGFTFVKDNKPLVGNFGPFSSSGPCLLYTSPSPRDRG